MKNNRKKRRTKLILLAQRPPIPPQITELGEEAALKKNKHRT